MTAPSINFTAGGIYGVPLMKFALTFDGELRANGNIKAKWNIRKEFHPQLAELWRLHPATQAIMRRPLVPQHSPYMPMVRHHSVDPIPQNVVPTPNIDLCEVVGVGGRKFLPLVREKIGLRCSLNILFLRKEEPGRVYQGGDMDNRLKTLFDALGVPNKEQIVDDPTLDDPIYCLVEDDALITALNIKTERLLSRPNSSPHEVHLVVEVDVRVTHPRPYNEPFLGD